MFCTQKNKINHKNYDSVSIFNNVVFLYCVAIFMQSGIFIIQKTMAKIV